MGSRSAHNPEEDKSQDNKRLAPEGDSQVQLKEGFHLCSPRVGEEVPGLEMQAGGQPKKQRAIIDI